MQTTGEGRRLEERRLKKFRTECEETRSGPGANVFLCLDNGARVEVRCLVGVASVFKGWLAPPSLKTVCEGKIYKTEPAAP